VLEAEIPAIKSSDIEQLWDFLAQYGYRYRLEPIQGVERFGIHSPSFFSLSNVVSNLSLSVEHDFVEKIRFVFLEKEQKLLCVPMIFPKLVVNGGSCNLALYKDLPFTLPCQNRAEHPIDKLCYLSICLLINSFLARKFLLTLKKSSPQLYSFFEKIRIKKSDLIRYLGEKIGIDISTQIEEFIKKSSPLDNIIASDKTCPDVFLSPHPFSRKNLPIILQHLREGYENAIKEHNDDPVGVKYAKPVEYLLEMGIHPLMFTEVLDELCDFGVIVPITAYLKEEKCWRRIYRTGEGPHDTLPWVRSQWILPLAIQTLDLNGVERMYLEKAMANFVYDFPSYTEESMKNYLELHCFVTKPSYWGAQVFIVHPMSHETLPLSPMGLKSDVLDKWKDFAVYFDYDREKKKFVSWLPLKGISQVINQRLVRDYFRFMAQLKEKSGKVDALNTLSLCRNKDWFYLHLMYNIYRWSRSSYSDFLKGLCKGEIRKKSLDFAETMAVSAEEKLKNARKFPSILEKCKHIVESDPISFEDVWNSYIRPNIKNEPLLDNLYIANASKVIKAMRTLDGITRLKLNLVSSSKRKETEKKVFTSGPQELHDIGVDVDIIGFLNGTHNYSEVYNFLHPIYQRIIRKIGELPKPKNERDLIENWRESAIRRAFDFLNVILPPEDRITKALIDECIKKAEEQFKMVSPTVSEIKRDEKTGKAIVKIQDAFKKEVTGLIENGKITRMKTTSE
jgi:hypothetical protein